MVTMVTIFSDHGYTLLKFNLKIPIGLKAHKTLIPWLTNSTH